MKAVGVIVEYNPFHNGHAFHVQAARETANADIVIAVMSGNFLQRGEPALVSKWYRTKMALLGGVDLVFELPYPFATQNAELFADGAVSILDAVQCESFCFGSESGDISSFLRTIDFLKEHQEIFDENVKRHIKSGVSYPKALSLSFQEFPETDGLLNLAKPNNILGFQYIKSIKKLNSQIKPLTVARKNANYHDEHFASETIASATSIRKALFSTDKHSFTIEQFVPEQTNELLKAYSNRYGTFHQWENYWSFLQFRIIQSSPEELRKIYEVEEGIENRLKAAALTSGNFQEFMEKVKTKRYTWTRLQRICVHILTNATKEEMSKFERANYLRLLGMTQKGKAYLNKRKFELTLPLVSKLSSYKQKEIMLDIKAAQIYAFGLSENLRNEFIQQEFKQTPIILE
ncbi:nucleotidyltransferase [Neobacillus niacini]|uniref:nucleotidyltransferase n=1 Tax=Neobacillus niacini TaxID=86668 RepID=UPI002855F910|nr:nucleotidyltransferase [Neobacillus niacini]MDR6998019.1 putative nucleotidyltransferase [Neobacillus niacini]